MKRLWNLLNSMLIVAASTSAAQTLVAQENDTAGVVRISNHGLSSQLVQVSVTSCGPSGCGPNGMGAGNPLNSGVPGMPCDICGRRCQQPTGNSAGQVDGYGNGVYAGNGSNGAFAANGAYGGNGSFGHGRFGHGRFGHAYDATYDGCPNPNGQALSNYLHCKFGYFTPSGGGGQGLPWFGHYSRVYPVTPYYSDSRDGQAWSAQGYHAPISVPLAPVVAYTYEYGWGVPSSRIVPVSRPAY